MIDHMTFSVKDIEKTKAFYAKGLETLGYTLAFEDEFDGAKIVGFSKNSKIDTWFVQKNPVSGPTHIAWTASSREMVDDFYAACISAGAKDNGKPGPRPHYHPNYYGAFVIDPDGNNVEACCHTLE